jgi:hypothetical protein
MEDLSALPKNRCPPRGRLREKARRVRAGAAMAVRPQRKKAQARREHSGSGPEWEYPAVAGRMPPCRAEKKNLYYNILILHIFEKICKKFFPLLFSSSFRVLY